MLGTTIAGMAVSIFNTRYLSPEAFSDFRLILSALNLLAVILPCGVFYSLGRLFSQSDRPIADDLLRGTAVSVFFALSVFATIFVFFLSPYYADLFQRDVSKILSNIAPLAGAFMMQGMLENQLQGENRILSLAIYRIAPSVAYFCFASGVSAYFEFSTEVALVIQLGSVVSIGYLLAFVRPIRFSGVRGAATIVIAHVRGFGFPVYLGALASVAVGHLGVLILGYFVPGPDVGFFALAQTMSMPLTILGSAVGTSSFKDFASAHRIPFRSIVITLGICISGLFVYQLIIAPVFHIFYTEKYESALGLARIAAVGYALHGVGDFFNRFLCAHGQGARVRNGAFVLGFISLSSYFAFSYFGGAKGAAIAVTVSSVSYFLIMVAQYRRYVGLQAQ